MEMVGAGVDGVGPFAQGGLDEAFGLAIGARSIRAGQEVALSGGTEEMGAIARAMVAHAALSLDAEGSEVSEGAFEEENGAVLPFIRHDLSEGEAGSVVNANMNELPTSPADLITSVVGDAVAGAHDLA